MSELRPTFHEFWHRVAELKPRLRAQVRAHRQHSRGHPHWVLHDTVSNKLVRVGDPIWRMVGLLDGNRTLGEAWELCHQSLSQVSDMAPTQGEALQALGQLYQSGMLVAEVMPDAEAIFHRIQKRRQSEMVGAIKNILFLKIPLFNPDRLVTELERPFGFLFTRFGFGVWSLCVGLATWFGIQHGAHLWGAMWGDTKDPGILRLLREGQLSAMDLAWLYLAMIALKICHELGHGIACKRMAKVEGTHGMVPESGMRLMMLVPAPYVDASSSWALASRWRRAMVALAGMYVEILIGAGALAVWLASTPGSVTQKLALQVILLVGASVVLFNANPLIRYDGYYVLCDALELPNLAQRAQQQWMYLLKKYGFGVRGAQSLAWHPSERPWLLAYGALSFCYMTLLGLGIAWTVANQYLLLGLVLAVISLVGWGVWPVCKAVWYLLTSPELARTRVRAWAVSVGLVAIPVLLLGVLPMPDRERAEGVVHLQRQEVFARESAWVMEILPEGSAVQIGDTVAKLHCPELEAEQKIAQAELEEAQLKARQATEEDKPAIAAAQREKADSLQGQLVQLADRLSKLQPKAELAGIWHCPVLDGVSGGWLEEGQTLGAIQSSTSLEVRVAMTQDMAARVVASANNQVDLRVRGLPGWQQGGTLITLAAEAHKKAPPPSLSEQAGGRIVMDNTKQDTATQPFLEAQVQPDGARVIPPVDGLAVEARFHLGSAPAVVQAWRYVQRQLMGGNWE